MEVTTIERSSVKRRLIHHLSRLVGEPSMADEDMGVYKQVIDHISDNLHTGKGILMSGNIGSGKTSLMKASLATIKDLLTGFYDHPPTKKISAGDLNDLFGNQAVPDKYREFLCRHKFILIDDLGTEEPYNTYHQTMHATHLIQAAYDMPNAPALYMSMNIGGKDASKRYGDRVVDRLFEMCHFIQYETSKSKRR